MGYNTKFSGVFMIDKRIDERTFEIIEEIRDSRHDDRVMPRSKRGRPFRI